jgi:hypothetical protein
MNTLDSNQQVILALFLSIKNDSYIVQAQNLLVRMTIEQIKEQLSNRFIGILAANSSFQLDKGELDFGVDYTARKTRSYIMPGTGKTRITCDPRSIDIQLKATTESSVTNSGTNLTYSLESKTFNDLVHRQADVVPLILILFVLPDNRNDWVDLAATELRLRRLAYWWRPAAGTAMTNNVARITIRIPQTNILSINCFDTLHAQFYP